LISNILSLLSKASFSIRIIVFLVLSVTIAYKSSQLYDAKTVEFKNKIYSQLNDKVLDTVNLLLEQKKRSALLSARMISKNPILLDILEKKRYSKLKLKEFSEDIRCTNVRLAVIDTNGLVLQRSWTEKNGDNIEDSTSIENIIKKQQVKSIYIVNEFGFSINTLMPIIKHSRVVGVLNFITQFDSIVDEIKKIGFRSVILLSEKESNKINIRESLSQKFIEKNYVTNLNADVLSTKIINNVGVEKFLTFRGNYNIREKTNTFETIKILQDESGNDVAYMVFIQALDDIYMEDLEFNQNIHLYLTIFIIIAIGLISYYRNSYKYISQIKVDNEKLLIQNSTLNDKNDELDFNEKKITNIFHIQPNFMLISDGKSIDSANARFLWFMSTYYPEGGLDEFRKHHRCISDYFEPCDDPDIDTSDYISSDQIDGMPWKDYILKNFKKNYKVCMRNGYGKLHHFIIKMNEMEYAKFIKRYIVISFIDITHEIDIMKQRQEQKIIEVTEAKDIQMNEIISDMSKKFNIPLETIRINANELKQEKEQAIVKAQEIEATKKKLKRLTSHDENEIRKVNISDMVSELLETINQTYKNENIEIIKNFTSELLLRTMISGDLSKVIINIMSNAKDELIRNNNTNRWIAVSIKKMNNEALIAIEDNAGGILQDNILTIFEQYVTSKDQRYASGLGLFVAKRLIQNNLNGLINVENTKNGAMFVIRIPLDKENV